MSANAVRTDILLPSDDERRKIFFWLKQLSSVTAWSRILEYYQRWAGACELSVAQANARGLESETRLPESDYVLIMRGLAHFEQGVRRLRKGDKPVFKYDANGEFIMASRILNHWSTLLTRIEFWHEHPPIDPDTTPNWPAVNQTLTDLAKAWGECSIAIIETRDLNAPARLPYGSWLQQHLPLITFPLPLPAVPSEPTQTLVATGRLIPFSGIWEPVDLPKRKGLSLFRSGPVPSGDLPIAGCMNYLHGGSPAPKASLETADANPSIATTWRLLWRDDRYEDGTIPAEESDYVFVEPSNDTEPAPEISVATSKIIWADSGQISSHTGRWLLESDLTVSIEVQAGDELPLHQGRPVRWVLAD